MANTSQDIINASMGRSQDSSADDYQSAMGGWQPGFNPGALTFSTGEPLQFSNGQYLELAA